MRELKNLLVDEFNDIYELASKQVLAVFLLCPFLYGMSIAAILLVSLLSVRFSGV